LPASGWPPTTRPRGFAPRKRSASVASVPFAVSRDGPSDGERAAGLCRASIGPVRARASPQPAPRARKRTPRLAWRRFGWNAIGSLPYANAPSRTLSTRSSAPPGPRAPRQARPRRRTRAPEQALQTGQATNPTTAPRDAPHMSCGPAYCDCYNPLPQRQGSKPSELDAPLRNRGRKDCAVPPRRRLKEGGLSLRCGWLFTSATWSCPQPESAGIPAGPLVARTPPPFPGVSSARADSLGVSRYP
jgi:hypothetical protein